MPFWTNIAKALLTLALAISAVTLSAIPPASPPPRGHAYGYYLKDGAQVTLIYLDDGSRIIDLSNCRARSEYLIEASEDLVTWQTVTILRIQSDGTATYLDTTPMPFCFYRVNRVR